jgi:hypothetical protein
MTAMILDVPDDLAQRLEPVTNHLPEILNLGLRAFQTGALPGFPGAADVLEFLARLPSPEEILALQPATALVARVDELSEKSATHGLTMAEEQEWQQYEYLEHLVRIAKIKAKAKLAQR